MNPFDETKPSDPFVRRRTIEPYSPGELSGWSFAVKDNIDVAHELTGYGSPGWLDTHTAVWNYGDESSGPGVVTQENEAPDATGTVAGGHSYFTSGDYTVILTLTDDDAGADTDTVLVTVNPIEATIDFDPNTLNLTSGGNWVTVYIELPEGYDVRNIVNTPESPVMLNGVVQAETNPKYGFVTSEDECVMDHDGDGISERMVKRRTGK